MKPLPAKKLCFTSARHKVDLLVADYQLPGMTGVELMHKIRVRHPEVKVILITGMTERKVRDEMLNAGALAIFDKPIPLADFLDVVERSLGLVQTIFPLKKRKEKLKSVTPGLSDLLANFRQDIKADAFSCSMTADLFRRALANCTMTAWKFPCFRLDGDP